MDWMRSRAVPRVLVRQVSGELPRFVLVSPRRRSAPSLRRGWPLLWTSWSSRPPEEAWDYQSVSAGIRGVRSARLLLHIKLLIDFFLYI